VAQGRGGERQPAGERRAHAVRRARPRVPRDASGGRPGPVDDAVRLRRQLEPRASTRWAIWRPVPTTRPETA
jgi:hypothetical protein